MKNYIKKKYPVIIIASILILSIAIMSVFTRINPLWIILPILWILYNIEDYIYTKKETG